jgi:2-haloalkanoic acid dehalogenase type II
MSTPRWDVLTFDCYGTLIDWEGGIGAAFQEAALRAGVHIDRQQAVRAYAQRETQEEAAPYRSYRSVLAASAARAAQSLGWQIDLSQAEFLPRNLPFWRPFDDTNPALLRLVRAGYELGLLSNIDDDLLRETRKHFAVEFDFAITAQQVGSYKPHHGHFEAARRVVGSRRWLHCAQSYFHDVEPALAMGIPVAWINRRHETPLRTARPDLEFENLQQLALHLT